MIRSTIPAGQTSRTVQQDIDGIKTDIGSAVNKVDKVDSQMQGDVVISPKPSEGLETTLSINSTGTSGNIYSTLYLNNAGQNGKLFFNTPIVGLVLSTTGAPIRLSPNNNEALLVNNDKSCLFGGDVTVTGNMKNKIQLSNNFPSNAISSVISENTSATGYARLQLQTPSNVAYMQVGKNEGLLVSTETALPMMFSPNKSEAMRLNANGNATFWKDVEVTGLATSGNIWIGLWITPKHTPTQIQLLLRTNRILQVGRYCFSTTTVSFLIVVHQYMLVLQLQLHTGTLSLHVSLTSENQVSIR